MLELDDRFDGFAGQDLRRVLVDQVVATLDGVEHVPLPVVLLLVAERGADAALRGAGVGAGGVELGQDGRVDAAAGELQRGPQAGAAGADDQGLELVRRYRAAQAVAIAHCGALLGRVKTTIVPITNRTSASR